MRRIVLVLLILTTSGIAVAMAANDEVSILFNSWLEGKPLGLVKIRVETPKTDDVCFIAVHRFPTSYNPTKNGTSELIYREKVRCGETVVVRDFIKMVQVGMRDEINGETKPIFDSPEYVVVVISKSGGFSRIIQTDVVKPITEVRLKAEFERAASGKQPPGQLDFQTVKSTTCVIRSNPDVCVADTKLTLPEQHSRFEGGFWTSRCASLCNVS